MKSKFVCYIQQSNDSSKKDIGVQCMLPHLAISRLTKIYLHHKMMFSQPAKNAKKIDK
jgi:hypothetical protein